MEEIKNELKKRINDDKLVENLFFSFQKISSEYIAQNPVELLQNTGLFVESVLRIAEQIVLGVHTPLESKFNVDSCIEKLEKSGGPAGLRIHTARLCRSIYDFRSRKKAVHLKAVDPQIIDANLIFNISNWIFIEILKESGILNAEKAIKILFTRKVPLVLNIDGILRTTNPELNGTQRILLLLYSAPDGLSEVQLFDGSKQRIKNLHHLHINLVNMNKSDLVHNLRDDKWILFGRGFTEAEMLIEKIIRHE